VKQKVGLKTREPGTQMNGNFNYISSADENK
jgi:hypothetical protein